MTILSGALYTDGDTEAQRGLASVPFTQHTLPLVSAPWPGEEVEEGDGGTPRGLSP